MINLSKGGTVNLSKEVAGLTKVKVGLGWDIRKTDGEAFDLDASSILLNASDKCKGDSDMIFYNNKKSTDGSVEYLGDNKTGAGDGDDETVTVDLTKVSADVQKIVFTVSIYDAETRRQNFGMVSKAYIKVYNAVTNAEIAKFDLSEDASAFSALIFGELYRLNGEWKFRAVGQGYQQGFKALIQSYGLSV